MTSLTLYLMTLFHINSEIPSRGRLLTAYVGRNLGIKVETWVRQFQQIN
jgi:hypothetical protein